MDRMSISTDWRRRVAAPAGALCASLGGALLLAVLTSCQASCRAPSPIQSASAEPWVSITMGTLFRSPRVYRIEGSVAVRCDVPEPDPFAEWKAQEGRLAEEFLTRWEGPSEIEFEPRGRRKRPYGVPVKKVFLHAAPSGDRALLLASHRLLLTLPDTFVELPSLGDARYDEPASWHPDGVTVAAGLVPRSLDVPTEVVLIDTAELRVTRRLPLDVTWRVDELAWSPDGQTLAILAYRQREDTGLSKWISDVLFEGSHGLHIADYRLELHALDGSAPRLIPIADKVEDPGRSGVIWTKGPQRNP